VHLDMHQGLVPPPYADRLVALAEQGVVERQGERWRSVINVGNGVLSLNGQPVSRTQLQARVQAISAPDSDPQAEETETLQVD